MARAEIGDRVPVGSLMGVLVGIEPIPDSDETVLRVCLNHAQHQHRTSGGLAVETYLAEDGSIACAAAPNVQQALLLARDLQGT